MASSLKCPWGVKAQFTIPFKSLFYYYTEKGLDRFREGDDYDLRRTRWYSRCVTSKVTLDTEGSVRTRLIAFLLTAPWSHILWHLTAVIVTSCWKRP